MTKDQIVQFFQYLAKETGVDLGQLVKGTLDECKEHKLSIQGGTKIALDHLLKVDPMYYDKLEKMGL